MRSQGDGAGTSGDSPVRLIGVAREFGSPRRRIVALRPLSLSVGRGEVAALAGPNGSGKTTALRILAGLVEPTAGVALVCGHDPSREPAAARRAVGVSFGSGRSFYWRLTARQNLLFFARLAGLDGRAALERIRGLAYDLDLERVLDRPASRLSRGMLARLSVARALVHGPPVVLLDEPLASVDGPGRRAVVCSARGAAAAGAAVLLTVQDPEDAVWCDRVHALTVP